VGEEHCSSSLLDLCQLRWCWISLHLEKSLVQRWPLVVFKFILTSKFLDKFCMLTKFTNKLDYPENFFKKEVETRWLQKRLHFYNSVILQILIKINGRCFRKCFLSFAFQVFSFWLLQRSKSCRKHVFFNNFSLSPEDTNNSLLHSHVSRKNELC
jgi:hypothetical protein